MSDTPRDGDAERLAKLRRLHMHRWHINPVDEPELFFLLRMLDSRDAALREARAEIEDLKHDIERALQSIGSAEAEVDRLTKDAADIRVRSPACSRWEIDDV
jgi:hypothetical protein